jgi:fructose-bisphosphate aldolase class 1
MTMVAGDKGLLAMDESNSTCNKRFARLGIPQTEEARRAWREFIVTTLGLGESISGANVIVADKHLHLQYLDMDAAVRHCQKGIRIWPWARLTKVASRTS